MQIHSGRSTDGLNWQSKNERIEFVQTGGEPYTFEYGYDPRLLDRGSVLRYLV